MNLWLNKNSSQSTSWKIDSLNKFTRNLWFEIFFLNNIVNQYSKFHKNIVYFKSRFTCKYTWNSLRKSQWIETWNSYTFIISFMQNNIFRKLLPFKYLKNCDNLRLPAFLLPTAIPPILVSSVGLVGCCATGVDICLPTVFTLTFWAVGVLVVA